MCCFNLCFCCNRKREENRPCRCKENNEKRDCFWDNNRDNNECCKREDRCECNKPTRYFKCVELCCKCHFNNRDKFEFNNFNTNNGFDSNLYNY